MLRTKIFGALISLACMILGGEPSPAVAQTAPPPPASSPDIESLRGCPSGPILSRFEDFGRTGRMPADLGRWLADAKAQYIEPYQAFDNVWFVGVCWVSAWLVKTSAGYVLIDTLHEPFVDQLLDNIRKVGVNPADIRYVLMTHGHFDHVGGAYKIKPLGAAKFVMTQRGWDEAMASSKASESSPRPWKMLPVADVVVKDGDQITLGDTRFDIFETPGHTYGTASYGFDVKDGSQTYRAFVVGGLGLNAIKDSHQVEAYIASVERIGKLLKDGKPPVSVHLTTHPFSTGLTETSKLILTRQPGQPHPLVDPKGFAEQLQGLRTGAEERLLIERKNERR